jgi:hypothetical protein
MSVQSDAAKDHLAHLFTSCRAWAREWQFHPARKWRFDFADIELKCAIELDGGTFQSRRTGHSSGTGLRTWREKNNAAMLLGWRVWHYAPEEIIKAGRKTIADEPILKALPWH